MDGDLSFDQQKRFSVQWLGLIAAIVIEAIPACAIEPISMMPHSSDRTTMWWADGFPSHDPSARWLRCIRSGYYGFALNTEKMEVSYLRSYNGQPEPVESEISSTDSKVDLALRLHVDGERYDCISGGPWSRHGGPRLIESGRFFQRGDVTDLVFASPSGKRLNVDSRFETAAWADRLALILSARPGRKPIVAGEESFGIIGGGFGLDGKNYFEVPHSSKIDTPQFTIALWAFVPNDYRVSQKTYPWIVCKNRNEAHDGNYGIAIVNGHVQAKLNIGGGQENAFTATANQKSLLRLNDWNHLAISYDGDSLRLCINGQVAASERVGKIRVPGSHPLAFGRRQDNIGDGFHFRGVIDEIVFHDYAIPANQIRDYFFKQDVTVLARKPVKQWSFRGDVLGAKSAPREVWKSASMSIGLRQENKTLSSFFPIPSDDAVSDTTWHEVSLAIDPIRFEKLSSHIPVLVRAVEIDTGESRPVDYDPVLGWQRINLDEVKPSVPTTSNHLVDSDLNNTMERIWIELENPNPQEQVARLMFEKTGGGIKQPIGSPITGVSAVLRDEKGNPTGIPVQLSKNWHMNQEAGIYRGLWFHGISLIRLPPGAKLKLELSIVYGHWGGVPAASHSQLCLIGWGSNQRWDQSALGSWGESICYEADQVQGNCSITDVRPLMVRMSKDKPAFQWTCNVGGGDWFRLFDSNGKRVPPKAMKTTEASHGPCLTGVTFSGRLGTQIRHSAATSLGRTDDLVRGTYRLKMSVDEAVDFSRLVIFQIGADTYNMTRERKTALGNLSGLRSQWDARWGGNRYHAEPIQCLGQTPWVSMHDAIPKSTTNADQAWANRGIVIRSWKARLGGKKAMPWIAQRGLEDRGVQSATIDIVPPPGIKQLVPGDFVDATIEYIVVPQAERNYYGPNGELRETLRKDGNTWKMIFREAVKNDRKVSIKIGEIQHRFPNIEIRTENDRAEYTFFGGLGYVPITFTHLSSPTGYTLFVNDDEFDQAVHGNDFWQVDFDSKTRRWSQTYNIPVKGNSVTHIRFENAKEKHD